MIRQIVLVSMFLSVDSCAERLRWKSQKKHWNHPLLKNPPEWFSKFLSSSCLHFLNKLLKKVFTFAAWVPSPRSPSQIPRGRASIFVAAAPAHGCSITFEGCYWFFRIPPSHDLRDKMWLLWLPPRMGVPLRFRSLGKEVWEMKCNCFNILIDWNRHYLGDWM